MSRRPVDEPSGQLSLVSLFETSSRASQVEPHSAPLSDATTPGVSWPLDVADSPRPEDRELFEALQQRLDGRLESLVLTDNRLRILTVRPAGRGDSSEVSLQVRLHRAFVAATDEVLDAVTVAIEGTDAGHDRESRALARRVLRGWMKRFWSETEPAPVRRSIQLQPTGLSLDLRQVRDDLNQRFFGGRLSVEITWSRVLPGAVCRTRSIRLGSFQEGVHAGEPGVVRIHPALDQPGVPRYVVESIVYHELLHADIPPVVLHGRRHVHTPEFRRRERQFPDHRRAKRWIRHHLGRLLRY